MSLRGSSSISKRSVLNSYDSTLQPGVSCDNLSSSVVSSSVVSSSVVPDEVFSGDSEVLSPSS